MKVFVIPTHLPQNSCDNTYMSHDLATLHKSLCPVHDVNVAMVHSNGYAMKHIGSNGLRMD